MNKFLKERFKGKILFTLLLFSISSFAFSQSLDDSLKFEKFKEIKDLKEKYLFFWKWKSKKEIMPYEDWILYLEKDLEVNKGKGQELFYLQFNLVSLYKNVNRIEESINIGLKAYYKNKDFLADNEYLCHILSLIENSYLVSDNTLGLIKINNERLKICNPDKVNFYSLYSKMGLHKKALDTYRKKTGGTKKYSTLKLFEKGTYNNNIGVYFMRDEKIDSALYYYRKSFHLLDSLQKQKNLHNRNAVDYWVNLVKGNIAQCYIKKDKYKEAIPLFLDEIKSSEEYLNKESWHGDQQVWRDLTFCYIKTKQYTKAINCIKKIKKNSIDYYFLKANYYKESFNQKDSSIFYFEKYLKLSDSLNKDKNQKEGSLFLKFLSFEDELINQQKEIINYEKETLVKEKTLKYTYALIFVLGLFIIYIYTNLLEKNKQQKITLFHKSDLEKALIKNKVLLKELNHRVKNNLQMINSFLSLQSNKIKDLESKKYFENSINRIKFLSKIHDSLFLNQTTKEIDLASYLNKLETYFKSSINNLNQKFEFTFQIDDDIILSDDKKITLGIIVNELITNSIKHAFSSSKNNSISLFIKKEKDIISFTYFDSGKNFNINSINKSNSMGLNLIMRLTNQLGSEVEMVSEDNKTIVKFSFK